MIIVMGQYRLPADRMDELRPHMARVLAATRAEEGCLLYSFVEAVDDPGLIRLAEKWESRAHLEAHYRQPHLLEWRAAMAASGGPRDRDVSLYEIASEERLQAGGRRGETGAGPGRSGAGGGATCS